MNVKEPMVCSAKAASQNHGAPETTSHADFLRVSALLFVDGAEHGVIIGELEPCRATTLCLPLFRAGEVLEVGFGDGANTFTLETVLDLIRRERGFVRDAFEKFEDVRGADFGVIRLTS